MDFKNVDKKYRPVPFWSWNDKLNVEESLRQTALMDESGHGGYFMHARGGLETEYMGEEWFQNVAACIEDAKARGMHAWAYDENGYPSGFGSGKVNSRGEAYQQKFLRMQAADADRSGWDYRHAIDLILELKETAERVEMSLEEELLILFALEDGFERLKDEDANSSLFRFHCWKDGVQDSLVKNTNEISTENTRWIMIFPWLRSCRAERSLRFL